MLLFCLALIESVVKNGIVSPFLSSLLKGLKSECLNCLFGLQCLVIYCKSQRSKAFEDLKSLSFLTETENLTLKKQWERRWLVSGLETCLTWLLETRDRQEKARHNSWDEKQWTWWNGLIRLPRDSAGRSWHPALTQNQNLTKSYEKAVNRQHLSRRWHVSSCSPQNWFKRT